MTAIHHKVVADAIVSALEDWLLAKLPDGATQPVVLDAWPDFQAERPAGKAFLVVSTGDPQTTPFPPVLHASVAGEGVEATHVWRVADFQSAAQLDVFSTTKLLGEELAHLVSNWLSTPPMNGSRVITVTDYWSARFKVRGRSVSSGPDTSPLDGQWRQTFSLIVDGPVLSDSIGTTLDRLDVELTVGRLESTLTLE